MKNNLLKPSITPNDKQAKWLIYSATAVVFVAVIFLHKVQLDIALGFDKHIFALLNAIINSTVSILLIVGIISVKQKKYSLHKRVMLAAVVLSIVFLLSYIVHHLLAGDTKFGGEPGMKILYLIVLFSHILLAAGVLPFILFSVYRGLTGEYEKHKKIVKYTFPIWLYVSVTGVLVYFMISPYYS
jgi:putative membrane protein